MPSTSSIAKLAPRLVERLELCGVDPPPGWFDYRKRLDRLQRPEAAYGKLLIRGRTLRFPSYLVVGQRTDDSRGNSCRQASGRDGRFGFHESHCCDDAVLADLRPVHNDRVH